VQHLPYAFAYLDDTRVGSVDRQKHLEHLDQLFAIMAENGLSINIDKCVFAVSNLEILGHTISATGTTPLPAHTAAIGECPRPTDIKQLQRYLGMVNFYRRFIPRAAQVLRPLTDLLKGGGKTVEWSAAAENAFLLSKKAVSAAVPLHHPDPSAELSLATDASDSHIGGVLHQKVNNLWQPLGFFSKKLSATECRYSTFDRELLAAYLSIRHFLHMLQGRSFQLWTDHKPLLAAMTRISPPISPRQQRHLAFISEFNVLLVYVPGPENVVADFLSRPQPPQVPDATTAAATTPVD
ncbi:MAG: hypothetical protein AN484_26985, partial [Aphanizomenon flos-aquae WA102]